MAAQDPCSFFIGCNLLLLLTLLASGLGSPIKVDMR
ncbi:hypothetical protein CYB_1860 [Synechococcus sp. JA-2-3B'a(2-13)]|nr:hypothetical protein CYB_1860 [Synechococcus sp. JA-2-3B'a(2-13)]